MILGKEGGERQGQISVIIRYYIINHALLHGISVVSIPVMHDGQFVSGVHTCMHLSNLWDDHLDY